MNYSTIKSMAATTALTCSPRPLHMTASCETLKPCMGGEFMVGKDPIALVVNNLCANVSTEKLALQEVQDQ